MPEKNGSFMFNNTAGFLFDEDTDKFIVIPVITIGLIIAVGTVIFVTWKRFSSASRHTEDAEYVHELGQSQQQPLTVPQNIEDEAMAAVHFAEGFTKLYGDCHPIFFCGSLNDAMKEACYQPVCNRKLLAVYLHHNDSVSSNIFCTQVLCSESVVSLLNSKFICLGWDVTLNSNRLWLLKTIARHFSLAPQRNLEDELPLFLIVTRTRDTNMVLAEIPGSVSVDKMRAQLLKAVEMFSQQQHDEMTEEEDREKREMYEREQDEATQLSFQADGSKEELKRQSEAVKQRQVEKQRVQEEQELMAEINQYEAVATAFSTDKSQKTLRFDLQSAINHQVNDISHRSGQHLQENLDNLRNLLQGNEINVGNQRVRATVDPRGLLYCASLLARKLVEQVCVKFQETFVLAAVITELWSEFPIFGRLVLANFYRQCPYLIPVYPTPREESQSDEEFFKSLGYKYLNGKVEQELEYLERMSRIVRLYAAVTISLPRRNPSHPHGLHQAWKYLESLLHLSPQSDFTASILVEFLTVTGNAMEAKYGEKFQQMLDFIHKDFIAQIRSVTLPLSDESRVDTLQFFLNQSMGGIEPPADQLSPEFW